MLRALCYDNCCGCMPILQFCNCLVSIKHDGSGKMALSICKNQLYCIMQYCIVMGRSWYINTPKMCIITPLVCVYLFMYAREVLVLKFSKGAFVVTFFWDLSNIQKCFQVVFKSHTHTCMHARTHARTHALTHARTHAHTHTHIHTHTHTQHTHTQTHAHYQKITWMCTSTDVHNIVPI